MFLISQMLISLQDILNSELEKVSNTLMANKLTVKGTGSRFYACSLLKLLFSNL